MRNLSASVETIMFVLAIINAISAAFIAAYVRLTGTRRSGLGLFTLGKVSQSLSWALRLAVYLGAPPLIDRAADLFLLLGFSLEAALFLRFGGKREEPGPAQDSSGGPSGRFLAAWTALAAAGILALPPVSAELKNLVILATYLAFMGMVAFRLIAARRATPFQRLLGLIYGSLPLASSILFVSAYAEVTVEGAETTGYGVAYYLMIFTMQIVGSVGYLLMVKERDENALGELATRDPLSGALNRRSFTERAELLLANAAREGREVGLIMADLDRFKQINDRYGHETGDRVIRHFCAVAGGSIRKGDVFARYGGEEFAILLPSADRAEALAVAARIRAALAGRGDDARAEGLPRYAASFGVTTGHPGGEDLDRLLRAADVALYASKRGGRDRASYLPLDDGGAQPEIAIAP